MGSSGPVVELRVEISGAKEAVLIYGYSFQIRSINRVKSPIFTFFMYFDETRCVQFTDGK
jgi:hypothetical protein